MARKKKVVEKEEDSKELVEVKNSTNYSGNVKITIFRKGNKVKTINTHNTGTLDLCKYMRNALIGENVIAKRPGIIKICKKQNDTLVPYYSYGIVYTNSWINPSTDEDISASCTLSFLIPSNILTNGMKIEGLQLFSLADNDVKYADLDLRDASFSVSGDASLEVEWTLKVSYK